jgi:hypothetical protein
MQRLKLPASTLAAALLVCSLAGAAHAQATRLFTDWQAACDNLRACAALGMGSADAESFGFIDVRRGAGANAEPQVSLAFTFETELQELPLEISFDPPGSDAVFPRQPRARIGRDGLLRLDLPNENLAPFLAALRRAEFLRVRRLDDTPRDQASTIISLKGAVAALRWIDEQQQRTGNVTAMVARGDRPATAIAAPPAPPVVTRSPLQASQIEGKAPPDILALRRTACPDLSQDSEGEEIGYQLTPDLTLWQMPCAQGAYNFSMVYFLQPRASAPRRILFDRPENGGLVANLGEIINGEFQDDERSIFFFAKGRGLGDCGARGSYVWNGRSFALASWQEMPTCRGAPLDLWPVLWRTERREGR